MKKTLQFARDGVTDTFARRLLVAAALVALPAWLLFWNWGNFAWLVGVQSLYHGKTLYVLNSANAAFYPYLPPFALALAGLAAPVYSLTAWWGPTPPANSPVFRSVWVVITNFWPYLSLVAIPYCVGALFDRARRQRWAVVALLAFPWLWVEVLVGLPNSLVALLAVGSILAAVRERWILAGALVSLSAFKFTGLPLTLVLFIYAGGVAGRWPALRVLAGGVVAQIPTLAYFVAFPADLRMIIRRGGALSYHAGTVLRQNLLLQPVKGLGLVDAYTTVFPLLVVAFGIAGGLAAIRLRAGLPAGYAVGYFATSWLIPGEQRFLPFVVFLAIVCVPMLEDRRVRWALGTVYVSALYFLAARYLGYSVLRGAVVGEWTTGRFALAYAFQAIAPLVFVYVVSRVERARVRVPTPGSAATSRAEEGDYGTRQT